MDKSKEAENAPGKPIASEQQRGIRAAQLLANTTALVAAVVVGAINGTKTPPWLGD